MFFCDFVGVFWYCVWFWYFDGVCGCVGYGVDVGVGDVGCEYFLVGCV